MNLLVSILVAIIIIGVLLWAINAILGAVAIPEPFRTIIWVIAVLIAVLVLLQMTGIYSFTGPAAVRR